MKHKMNLQTKYYNFIKNGTKRIELRLFDEKRKEIKIWDEIEFSNGEESFLTEVTNLFKFESFEKLFENFRVETLADKSMNKKELLEVLNEFYSKDKQKEFGVLGIEIKLK